MSESYKIDQHTGYPFGYGPVGKTRAKVVAAVGGKSFEELLNIALDEGWTLHGNPFGLDHCVIQVLTKVVPVDQD
jgi:hypothetical protein